MSRQTQLHLASLEPTIAIDSMQSLTKFPRLHPQLYLKPINSMQLKPEYEFAAFENVYSMSGIPEQNFGGYKSDDNDNDDSNHNNDRDDYASHFDDMRNYLGSDEKANSLKRGPDEDPLEFITKRAKSDYGSFQHGPMGQFQQGMMGMEGNLFVSVCHLSFLFKMYQVLALTPHRMQTCPHRAQICTVPVLLSAKWTLAR
jgi:hypothetical protein